MTYNVFGGTVNLVLSIYLVNFTMHVVCILQLDVGVSRFQLAAVSYRLLHWLGSSLLAES